MSSTITSTRTWNISSDQAGFMPGREAKNNVIKALNSIHHTQKFEGLSTDVEKAFDRVVWDFMMATCKNIDFAQKILGWVVTLYRGSLANIRIKGSLSDTVHIQNGMKHGCPLSPLLFILTLEPFLRSVNADSSIQGLKVGNKTYKTAAYADNMLFFFNLPTHYNTKLYERF